MIITFFLSQERERHLNTERANHIIEILHNFSFKSYCNSSHIYITSEEVNTTKLTTEISKLFSRDRGNPLFSGDIVHIIPLSQSVNGEEEQPVLILDSVDCNGNPDWKEVTLDAFYKYYA